MKRKYFLLLVMTLVAVLMLTACDSSSKDESVQGADQEAQGNSSDNTVSKTSVPEKDKPVPPYQLTFLDGSTDMLDAHKGDVVVVSFFTTWCSYCKMELPELEEISKEVDNLTVIGVDVAESKEDVSKFVEEMGITFPVHCDIDGELSSAFLVNGFPTSIFISPDGNYIGMVPGYVPKEDFIKNIEYARQYKPE